MVNENQIYEGIVNTKHNIDGIDEEIPIYITPRETIKMREKNSKLWTRNPVTTDGIHLDRVLSPSVLDNALLNLDEPLPEYDLAGVICPFNTFIERFYTDDDIDTDISTGSYNSSTEQYILDFGGSGSEVPFEVPVELGESTGTGSEVLISKIIQWRTDKNFKKITMLVNGSDAPDIEKYVDYGDGWIQITGQSIDIENNVSFTQLKYKVTNTAVPYYAIEEIYINFEYY